MLFNTTEKLAQLSMWRSTGHLHLVVSGKPFWNDSMQDLYYFIFFNRKCLHYCTWFKTFGELIQLSFNKIVIGIHISLPSKLKLEDSLFFLLIKKIKKSWKTCGIWRKSLWSIWHLLYIDRINHKINKSLKLLINNQKVIKF